MSTRPSTSLRLFKAEMLRVAWLKRIQNDTFKPKS
jgi:hypothetical protein